MPMPDQNAPAIAPATAAAIDAADDSIRKEMEAPAAKPARGKPAAEAAEPEEVEEVEEEAEDDTEENDGTDDQDDEGDAPPEEGEQPATEDDEEPDAGDAQQGHPFTSEEDIVLRRSQATAEDIAYFRSLTVEQRNRALNPLRNALRATDRFFGMPKEERDRAIEAAQQQTQSGRGESAAGKQPGLKIALPAATAKELANELGVSEAAVGKLAEALLGPLQEHAARLDSERTQRDESQRAGALESAVAKFHPELARTFPKLKDKGAVQALLSEPDTYALYSARLQAGDDHGTAITAALKKAATIKYAGEISHNRTTRQEADRQKTLRGTAEPTARSKGPAPAKGKPRTLDEAHDRLMAEQGS